MLVSQENFPSPVHNADVPQTALMLALIYGTLYGERLFIFKPTQSLLGSEEKRTSSVKDSGPDDSLNPRVSI